MSDIEIEYQEKIPVIILDPAFQYLSEMTQIKQHIRNELFNNSTELIIDLSNFFKVDAETLIRLTEITREFGNRIKRFAIVIPKQVTLEGLKIKLINDFIEIYSNKYDAVYELLN